MIEIGPTTPLDILERERDRLQLQLGEDYLHPERKAQIARTLAIVVFEIDSKERDA